MRLEITAIHRISRAQKHIEIQLFLMWSPSAGVSIKFEVGSWLEKSNRLYEQVAVRPLNLGGSGGMLPHKI